MPKKEIVSELTQSEFGKLINDKKNKLVVVDFFAEWCMPCVMMAPIIQNLSEKHGDKVKFAKVNVDEQGELAQQFEISSIPCIIFFQDGKQVDRIVGGVAESFLEEKIRDYVSLN